MAKVSKSKYVVVLLLVLSMVVTTFVMATDSYATTAAQKKKEAAAAGEKAADFNAKVGEATKKVQELESNINSAQANINATQSKLEAKKAEVSRQTEALNSRLRAMYKTGTAGFINIILSSDNVSELITNVSMVQRVLSNDKKLLGSLQNDYNEIDALKKQQVEQEKVLKDNKSYLTKQYSRTRLSLEQAMLSQTLFTAAELSKILEHPVVKAMLSKLVLFNPETQASGFWQDGKLLSAEGTLTPLKADDKLLIAHPSHLFYAVQWDLYQKYLFDKELKQPFKQVFRELYVPTKDELETSNRSERYQGHQVQPQKTVALLRGRGWTVNYEEGLQRVYHKEGFRATIYAAADWYTPSDVEAPTLEYVVFYSLKDGKEVPMKDINPVIFSEVMRDVDLVVSVAHVGGVDPEASHSTMQMRAALARESARLFKLTNVEVKERHILIKGKLGEYSIHLGSGMVSQGGLQLSILAVQSQHRGRVFLPFVDDDPKSAEIISKMRLFAEDDKIKDPTILSQIK